MKTEYKNSEADNRVYLWKFHGEDIIVPGREIIYLHTEQRKVYVHTVNGVYRIGGTLKDAVKETKDLPMLKTHASFVVHIVYLQCINRHCATLKNGEHLPVSARCWPRIKPVIEAYIQERRRKNPLT